MAEMDLDMLAFVATHPSDPLVLRLAELRLLLTSYREQHSALTQLILTTQADVEDAWAALTSLASPSAPHSLPARPAPERPGPHTHTVAGRLSLEDLAASLPDPDTDPNTRLGP